MSVNLLEREIDGPKAAIPAGQWSVVCRCNCPSEIKEWVAFESVEVQHAILKNRIPAQGDIHEPGLERTLNRFAFFHTLHCYSTKLNIDTAEALSYRPYQYL